HPQVEITSLAGRMDTPVKYADLFPKMGKVVTQVCRKIDVDEISASCDVVFLALPHTVSMDYVPLFLERGKKVIDLSADYRLSADEYQKWFKTEHKDQNNLMKAVYGLPELNRRSIQGASLIANPGCYVTSVLLGTLPIAKMIAKNGITPIVDSKSGATGAGKKAETSLLFSEVDEDLKCYKADTHQHIPEMEKILGQAAGQRVQVHFVPHLLSIKRGILSTIYIKDAELPSAQEIHGMYEKFYKDEPFVRVRQIGDLPRIADVEGTNFCDIGITVSRGLLIIVSVIDNLLKGASGQAVQNMNIMCGFDERAGLL
ncbi:MAG TPA: N-acetyl-gamma-glutamyl-phosphate reductase, partial [Candidatus Omnitrophota bacterium]|nr:N-acetyl-gamma-glutamyl-phosphate reductase [Candidatus Omnitrophota bacterium]